MLWEWVPEVRAAVAKVRSPKVFGPGEGGSRSKMVRLETAGREWR